VFLEGVHQRARHIEESKCGGAKQTEVQMLEAEPSGNQKLKRETQEERA